MKLFDADPNADFGASGKSRARIGVVLGLLFLAGPLSDLLDESLGPGHLAALLVGLGLFVTIYLALLPTAAWLTLAVWRPTGALHECRPLPTRPRGRARLGVACARPRARVVER